MRILETLRNYKNSDRIAMINGENSLTYKELWEASDRLACYIKQFCRDDLTPVVVYGHKNPKMLVAFLACVKSGRAYVPVDITVPRNRVEAIIDSVKPKLILTTEEFTQYSDYATLNVLQDDYVSGVVAQITENDYVRDDSVYYIIFTSGSTGTPKGVQITYSALNYFTEWALTLGSNDKAQKRFINQAPFSFDLSVMDLYMSLASESCLVSLEKSIQGDYKALFARLADSDANVWVSTPSFADLCLADRSFCQELMPNMELFLFCGEILTNKTVNNLHERFPGAEVYNTYGPTESTVAITEVLVTKEVNEQFNPLPVGQAKPGTVLKIMDGMNELPEGEKGEIVIIGNTVSAGYFNNPKENERAFFTYDLNGTPTPAYRTGDKGYLQNGQLFYCGRIDLQIKLHGYRMEIEDVEKNLVKVEHVEKAVVVPVYEDGKVKSLKAYCIYGLPVESEFKTQKLIKQQMAEFVPDYMIPKKICFVSEIPMTANGKADRKRIQEVYS